MTDKNVGRRDHAVVGVGKSQWEVTPEGRSQSVNKRKDRKGESQKTQSKG